MNTKELAATLRMRRQILRGNVKSPRSVSLLDRNIDAADPRPIHAHMRDQVSSRIGHSNIHWLPNLRRLFFRSLDYPLRILQSNHSSTPQAF